MTQAKLGDLAQSRAELRQADGAANVLDDLTLRGRSLRGTLQIRGFGIDQPVDPVLRLAQRAYVFQCEYRRKGAGVRQQRRDRIEVLVIEHATALAHRFFRRDPRAAQHPLETRRDLVVANDELQMVSVRSGRERTARQERGAYFDEPIAFVRRFTRHRAQPLRQLDGEGRQTAGPRRRAGLDRMRFSFVEQRPKEPRHRVAMRDEFAARAAVQREAGKQRSPTVAGRRDFARQCVFRIGRGQSHWASSLRESRISYRSDGLTAGVTRNGTSRTRTVTYFVA